MKMVLMGNAGAGKSTLAKRLMGDRAITLLPLDDIAWNANVQRKPLADSVALLNTFIEQHEDWMIEGCYGDLLAAALPHCEQLLFLNPGVAACVAHCYQRPWEPDKFSSPEAQQTMLEPLIDWVKTYETRTDEFGLQCHRQLFETFTGDKHEYRSVAAYPHDWQQPPDAPAHPVPESTPL